MRRIKIIFGIIIGAVCMCMCMKMDAYAQTEKANNAAHFKSIVYKKMIRRETNIEIEYTGKDYKELFDKFEKEEFISDLAKIDDVSTSDDFDYMIQNVSYMRTSMKGITSTRVQFKIDIEWRENYGQLGYVNLRVEDILKKLKVFETDSVYQRIKLIHDYIVEHVEYDTTLKYENAYNALKEGKSTCQGYSLLFYKMVTDSGIPCRYITGTGISDKENGPHGWNIVKIGDLWYNVDTTWDDPIYTDPNYKPDENSYEFFLKGSKNYDDSHVKDAEFTTPLFQEEYIISEKDFELGNDVLVSEMIATSNNDITQSALAEPKVEEEKVTLIEKVREFISRIQDEIKNGNIKEYLVQSYKELDDKNKTLIIALFALILISIIYRSIRSNVLKKKEQDEYSYVETYTIPEQRITDIYDIEEEHEHNLEPLEATKVVHDFDIEDEL